MPFHALTAVYLDLLGPAHFHLDDQMHEHDHGQSHSHDHAHPERHRHHPGDDTVVTAEDDAGLGSQPEEGAASGWSATMCAVLASAGAAALHLPRLPGGIIPDGEPLLQTRFIGPLERPPSIDRV